MEFTPPPALQKQRRLARKSRLYLEARGHVAERFTGLQQAAVYFGKRSGLMNERGITGS